MNEKRGTTSERVTPCGKIILIGCTGLLVFAAIPFLYILVAIAFQSSVVQSFINDIRFYPLILIPAERETDLIAFVCWANDSTDMYTVRPDGSQLRLINAGNYMSHSQLSWSPDGVWIAMAKEHNVYRDRIIDWIPESFDSEIYLVRFDGLASRRLTHNSYDDRNPRWSEDGKAIYFEAQGDSYGVNHIGIATQVDPSNQQASSPQKSGPSSSQFSSDELASASLSPTGEWLAIVSQDGEHSAHGEWIKLGQDESVYRWARFLFRWSPYFLYLQDMNTGRVIRLINDVMHPNGVSWSPDGEWLAFASWDKRGLLKIKPDGSALTQLIDLDCHVTEVSWSPK